MWYNSDTVRVATDRRADLRRKGFTMEKKMDSGFAGKAFEVAIHELLGRKNCRVRTAGRTDERIEHKNYEIKTNAGTLGLADDRMVRGSSMVIYAPVVNANNMRNGKIDLGTVEGFVLTREKFLECVEGAGLLRNKTATNGTAVKAIQTFYNHSTDKPHGKRYFEFLDLLYENCESTLEEWIAEREGV